MGCKILLFGGCWGWRVVTISSYHLTVILWLKENGLWSQSNPLLDRYPHHKKPPLNLALRRTIIGSKERRPESAFRLDSPDHLTWSLQVRAERGPFAGWNGNEERIICLIAFDSLWTKWSFWFLGFPVFHIFMYLISSRKGNPSSAEIEYDLLSANEKT